MSANGGNYAVYNTLTSSQALMGIAKTNNEKTRACVAPPVIQVFIRSKSLSDCVFSLKLGRSGSTLWGFWSFCAHFAPHKMPTWAVAHVAHIAHIRNDPGTKTLVDIEMFSDSIDRHTVPYGMASSPGSMRSVRTARSSRSSAATRRCACTLHTDSECSRFCTNR